MKRFSRILVVLLMAPFAFSACSSNSHGGNTPDQGDANLAFQDTVDISLSISEILHGSNATCAELQTTLSSIVGGFPCEKTGSISYTLDSFECNDGPPLTGTFAFSVNADICMDIDDNTFDGSASFTFSGDEGIQELTATLSSDGLTVNDLVFVFDNLTVSLNTETNAFISCSGSASIDGSSCTADADCSACRF